MVEPEYIIAACHDLGFRCRQGAAEIRGYGGARTQVEIAMPTANQGFDIGFRRAGEHFEMVADWWGIGDINQQELLRQLTQRYAYRATRAQLAKQHFELVRETKETDGRLHLVLRRLA
jgi:hypothetical protein